MKLTALQKAVIEQLGYETEAEELEEECLGTLRDVTRGGADGGFTGFIYYTETLEFFEKNKNLIKEQLKEDAENFGTSIIDMVRNFNALSSSRGKERKPDYTEDEVGQVLYGPTQEEDFYTQIANCLAWYALEEVAQQLTDE